MRLLLTVLFGEALALALTHYLYPRPACVGEYLANNKAHRYVLRILNDNTAVLIVSDKADQKVVFRGALDYAPAGPSELN